MKSFKFAAFAALFSVLGLLWLVGCNQPAYLNPYGDDVDPNTMATIGFQSRELPTTTAFVLAKTTRTTYPTMPTTRVNVVPEGYELCPTCNGELQMCFYCKGTNYRLGEMLDPDSGIYKKYYTDCKMCSVENPGYDLCPTCQNELIVKK